MGKILIRLRQLSLILVDLFIFFVALYLALAIRYSNIFVDKALFVSHIFPFAIIFLIWAVVMFSNGLYDLPLMRNDFSFIKRIIETFTANTLISVAFFYLLPVFKIAPKTNLIITVAVYFVLFSFWRLGFNKWIKASVFKRKALFIGNISTIPELLEVIKPTYGLGLILAAVLDPLKHNKEQIKEMGIENFEDASKIRAIVSVKNIDTVILGPDFTENKDIHKELYELMFWGVEIVHWNNLYEELLGRVPIHILDEHWLFENINEPKKKFYDASRTIVDLILAVILFCIFAVLVPIVTLAILIESGRPVFYKQKRIGQNGKLFTLIKFRSMKATSPDGSAETNGPEFTKPKDERITNVGKFIRAVRIDELPQSINVLKREMNFIGPRPERPDFVSALQTSIPYFSVRHIIKPGITGWAQVNKPLHSSLEENLVKLEYDLFYIKNRSFLLDLVIILRTLNIIVRAMGR